MKILHVCHNYYPSVGGPQYSMKHISEKLVEYYGDTVEVCTTDSLYGPETKLYKKVNPSIENINSVKITRVPFRRWHYYPIDFVAKVYGKILNKRLPYTILKLRWGIDSPSLKKRMLQTDAEVIMATTIVYNFSDYPRWRKKRNNAKPFALYGAIHLHKELHPGDPKIKRAKSCDCYIANTEFEKTELVRYGVEAKKIVTIGTGVEVSEFLLSETEVNAFRKKHLINEDDVVIGFIGRLVKGKGVAVLIDAFRKVFETNKKVKLLLAGGTTNYIPEIKKIIKEEKLPIILVENFPDQFKSTLYNVLDIFVLGSQSESFGVVFLEAWACKKPVIGTRMGAIESLLSEGTDSLLFEPQDIQSLELKIKNLIDNPQKRIQFGLNGYKKVIENFTWPIIIGKYKTAYQLAIENFNAARFRTK